MANAKMQTIKTTIGGLLKRNDLAMPSHEVYILVDFFSHSEAQVLLLLYWKFGICCALTNLICFGFSSVHFCLFFSFFAARALAVISLTNHRYLRSI